MANPSNYTITVHLVQGDPLIFVLDPDEIKTKLIGLSSDLEGSLNRNAMAIELDNRLLVVPYSNIKYLECDPSPPGLPLTIIRGATSVEM